jgi:hypothetical protein
VHRPPRVDDPPAPFGTAERHPYPAFREIIFLSSSSASRYALPLRLVGAGAWWLLRKTPVRHRFGIAVALSRAAVPVLRRSPAAHLLESWSHDTPVETLLCAILTRMASLGLDVSPRMRVEGVFPGAVAGRGALVVGPRTLMHRFIVRWFHEEGFQPLPVADYDPYPVFTTRDTIPALKTSPGFMLVVRSALTGGRTVLAALGQEKPGPRVVRFATARGPMTAADSLIRLAERSGADLYFATDHLAADGAVVITIAAPSYPGERTAEKDVQAYVAFVQQQVAAAWGR